ncbi:MAG: glycosyltransferase family 4 protein [Terracoccus sp.]
MKILLLTHYYEPEIGAPQQRWSALVERFVRAGHQVSVIAPAPHYPAGDLRPEHAGQRPGSIHAGRHGETVHRAAFRSYGTQVGSRFTDQVVAAASAMRLVTARFRGHRPDVVVATVPSLPMLAAGAAVSRSLGVPLVVEMRDAWPDLLDVADEWTLTSPDDVPAPQAERGAAGEVFVTRPPLRPSAPVARWHAGVRRGGTSLLHHVSTSLQRSSDAVVTTTESFAQTLRDRGVEPVHVVRNGAHPIAGWPGPLDATSPDDPLRVLYAGTLGRAQGLTTVVKAASIASRAGTRVEVRVVGAGAEEHLLRELARRLGAPVDVRGAVPRAELVDHYAWADSVIVALRPWRGLSLTVPSKLYEAMSLGLHVSASVTGEAAGIVQQTQAGDVCRPGDEEALAALWAELAEDRSRVIVGPAAAEWVREHASDDRLADDYLAVLDSVVRS